MAIIPVSLPSISTSENEVLTSRIDSQGPLETFVTQRCASCNAVAQRCAVFMFLRGAPGEGSICRQFPGFGGCNFAFSFIDQLPFCGTQRLECHGAAEGRRLIGAVCFDGPGKRFVSEFPGVGPGCGDGIRGACELIFGGIEFPFAGKRTGGRQSGGEGASECD